MKINCDGGSRGNPGPAASAFVVHSDNKLIYKQSKFLGKETNNVAEYNAVLMACEWLKDNSVSEDVQFLLDSELIVKQINGIYKIKNENLKNIFNKIINIIKELKITVTFTHVYRENNSLADELVNECLDENK